MAIEMSPIEESESRRAHNARRRVVISEAVICATLDDEAVLLNVETGLYFGLDAIGSQIWALLAQSVAIDDICEQLYAEYEVSLAELRADVAEFQRQLIAKGLAQEIDN